MCVKARPLPCQKIVVKNYNSTNEINEAHILYVSPENSNYLKTIVQTTIKENTLLVSEAQSGLSRGSVINFIVEGNQQKYEINKTNAKKHKLVIAEKLSNLAANVVK